MVSRRNGERGFESGMSEWRIAAVVAAIGTAAVLAARLTTEDGNGLPSGIHQQQDNPNFRNATPVASLSETTSEAPDAFMSGEVIYVIDEGMGFIIADDEPEIPSVQHGD